MDRLQRINDYAEGVVSCGRWLSAHSATLANADVGDSDIALLGDVRGDQLTIFCYKSETLAHENAMKVARAIGGQWEMRPFVIGAEYAQLYSRWNAVFIDDVEMHLPTPITVTLHFNRLSMPEGYFESMSNRIEA